MLILDARCLQEPHPTGVTEVARQFIEVLETRYSGAQRLTTEKSFSNTLTNLALSAGMQTLESLAGAPHEPCTLFLPNTHFVHTRPDTHRVQVVHDLSFFHTPQWYPPRMRLWHYLAHAEKQIRYAETLIAVSEWTRQGLIKYLKIPGDRVHVVHPCTPLALEGQRPSLPFTDAPFFLFLGTLEKRKNIRGVLEAFELIKNKPGMEHFHLVLAGRSGFGAPHAHELGERVHHLSYISPQHKWWLLKNATALVYPSFFEGFGLPPLEAASVGCPTIVSDCTAPPETMGDASLLVSPYDIKQIAVAMHAIAIDPQLRAELSERGRARAAWFSTERQRDELLAVFETITVK